jgi:hypothetical protein
MQVQLALTNPPSNEEIFAGVWRELAPCRPLPAIHVRIRPYVNTMGKISLDQEKLEVRLSDLVSGAPSTVREALARILLGKLLRRPAPQVHVTCYRQWLNRREVRRTLHLVRQSRGRKFLSGPEGDHFHLDRLFESINAAYFDGLMARPALGWSRNPSRTLLGHYDPSHNAIILSRILDRAGVPGFVVEYVLFHEMLHLKHPTEHRGSRRSVHPPEFRREEKNFASYAEAKAWLKSL